MIQYRTKKIGIIGLGYVGTAVDQSYRDEGIEIVRIDTDPDKFCKGSYEDLKDADAVFICVSSPQNQDGSCDTSALESVLDNLKSFKGLIISRVTAPPIIYERLQLLFPNLVHAPEFLTSANAVNDYLYGKFCIIGGNVKAFLHEADRIIRLGQKEIETTHFCTIGEASLAKYVVNCFLATKVIFMNEMAALAEQGGQNWENIRRLIALDSKRIGNSHTQVPGFDGMFGFGGACFPKDTIALIKYAESLKVNLNVLDAAVKKNLILRLTESK